MTDPAPLHVPVLPAEVEHWLEARPGQIVVDGTLGGGGHARLLAEAVGPRGLVIALDRDPAAISSAERRLAGLPIRLVNENFRDLPEILRDMEIEGVHAVLLDLGMSSDQLADQQRGFSFQSSGPLDLRFDPMRGEPAWRLLNRLSAEHLANLLYEYGEERMSRRIARRIVQQRKETPIRSADQLARVVRSCVRRSPGHDIDPATRTFQALRIAVNDELKSLDIGLRRIPDCLIEGGRLAVISFHSLEDRRVKTALREDERMEVLTRKPIRASAEEIADNPRSRSARLRVGRRVAIPNSQDGSVR